jgi:anti-sigma-K factor RskA
MAKQTTSRRLTCCEPLSSESNPMIETTQAPQQPCHAMRWRIATVACLLVMVIASATGMSMFAQFKAQIEHMQTRLQSAAHIKYLAVLLDGQQAPAILVTLDPQDHMMEIQRLNSVKEGREDGMQLWALPVAGQPRSLGVLGSTGKTLRLKADDTTLADVAQLAISVEVKGGVAQNSGPSLPYLFTGAVVQKAL